MDRAALILRARQLADEIATWDEGERAAFLEELTADFCPECWGDRPCQCWNDE